MFLTGGVVVLTLVVNGTTTASLLNYLNLNPGSANKERALANMRHELREMCMKGYLDNFFDETLGGASFDTVKVRECIAMHHAVRLTRIASPVCTAIHPNGFRRTQRWLTAA
jgi:hypothetical protein